VFGFSSFSQAAYADDGVVIVAVSLTRAAGIGPAGTAHGRIVAFVPVTGVEATGGVGQIEAPNTGIILTGSAATGQVNNPTIIGDATVTPFEPLGFGTGAVGAVTVVAGAIVNVTGLSAIAAVGAVSVEADAIVPATGLEATGAVGDVTVVEGTGVTVNVTGVSATASVGSVTITGDATALVTGVFATGVVAPVLVWGNIVPAPGTSYTPIVPASGTIWAEIAA